MARFSYRTTWPAQFIAFDIEVLSVCLEAESPLREGFGVAHPRRRSGTSRRGRERRPHAADKAAPGTRSKTFADIRARTRPVRCLRSLVNERNKTFAGTKPSNSRENVDG